METTIYKALKGADMEAIFEKCSHIVNVRHYEAVNVSYERYLKNLRYKFAIKIRHNEGQDPNQLFEMAQKSLKEETGSDLMKRQYISQTRAYIKQEIRNIENDLLYKLDKAAKSGAIPEQWAKDGNHLLKKAIIDSFCLDRPYGGVAGETKKEFSNLHKFI